jgi:hypothetical protein
VNRSFPSSLAAVRTRSSPGGTLTRLGVRRVLARPVFSLAPPFAPPTPAPVARRRSPASQLLWRGLTSHARASPASAHHLPDADQGATALARREISRFPDKERTHMLGSTTAPGRPGARDDAPGHVAFRSKHSVGDPGVVFSRLNTQPMRTPVNASPTPSRVSAHDSGTVWFARPSLGETCTLYSLPVSRRTLCHGNRIRGASPWGKLPAWISSPTDGIASRRRSSSTRFGYTSGSH